MNNTLSQVPIQCPVCRQMTTISLRGFVTCQCPICFEHVNSTMFYSCGHQACTRCTEQIITPHLTTFNLLTSIDRAVEIQMIETIKTIETQMCSLEHNMNQIIILIQNFIDEYTSQQLSYLEKNNNNVEYSTSSFEVLDHKAKFYNLQSIITEMHIISKHQNHNICMIRLFMLKCPLPPYPFSHQSMDIATKEHSLNTIYKDIWYITGLFKQISNGMSSFKYDLELEHEIMSEMHIDHTIIENICRFIDSTVEDFNKVNELMHLVTDQLAFQSA